MVNADEYYGEFLKAADIQTEIEVTIKSVEPELIDGVDKLVIGFHEMKKSLVVNKTNKDRIKELLGSGETDDWVGKLVTLTTELVQYKGEEVPALRIKKKQEKAPASSKLLGG